MEHQVLWTEGRLAVEGADVVAYTYQGEYPPEKLPETHQVRSLLELPDTKDATLEISRTFMDAITQNAPNLIRSSFGDGMNSLAAVLGANASDSLNGQRVMIEDLLTKDEYDHFRERPQT